MIHALRLQEQLADKLRPCMTRSTHIPCMSVNLHTTEATFDRTNLASVGSVQLEFRALARATNKKPWEVRLVPHNHQLVIDIPMLADSLLLGITVVYIPRRIFIAVIFLNLMKVLRSFKFCCI